MAQNNISLSRLLLLSLLACADSAGESQACSESDDSTREGGVHSWAAVAEEQGELHGLELVQIKGLKKVRGEDPQAPIHTATSKTCNHELSGVDDAALNAMLAHKDKVPIGRNSSGLLEALRRQRIFIAVLLHESEAVLSKWTSELIRLLIALRATGSSPNIFVSVYESGSKDHTVQYLHRLKGHLKFMGIPNKIVTDGLDRETCRCVRIRYLSKLRNYAMQPLRGSAEPYDRVLWLSDNLFCADGVLQMLAHALPETEGGLGADAVCGMDYAYGSIGDDWNAVGKRCIFYDKWASHDIHGNNFHNDKPFVQSDREGFVFPGPGNKQLEAQQPFQVFSCWNAMVVFSADVFQKEKLAFRTPHEKLGECYVAETELIFRDMWSIGRDKILVSPSGASAYHEHDFEQCAIDKQPIQFDRASQISWKPAPKMLQCCPLNKFQEVVDFGNCFVEPWKPTMQSGVERDGNSSLFHNDHLPL